MKQLLIAAFLLCSITAFSQSKPKHHAKRDSIAAPIHVDSATLPQGQLPPGTIIFFLSPQQSQLLQLVIDNSEAGHRDVIQLTQILRQQQYIQPAPSKPKTDSISAPKIPLPTPSDSTAKKPGDVG